MSRMEKIAWFNMAVFGLVIILFLFFYYIYYTHPDQSINFLKSLRALALLALLAFGPILFKESGTIATAAEATQPGKSFIQKVITYGGIIAAVIIYLIGRNYLRSEPVYFVSFLIGWIAVVLTFLVYLYKKSQENSFIDNRKQSLMNLLIYGPNTDERDIVLLQRTIRYGLTAFWIYYASVAFGLIFWAVTQGTWIITVNVFLVVIFLVLGINIFHIVVTISIILIYRKEGIVAVT